MARCENCGSNGIVPVRILSIPVQEESIVCDPCAAAMVRYAPSVWARIPEGAFI